MIVTDLHYVRVGLRFGFPDFSVSGSDTNEDNDAEPAVMQFVSKVTESVALRHMENMDVQHYEFTASNDIYYVEM